MEHVLASYLRQLWDKNYRLYDVQHLFGTEYSCEIEVITACHLIAESLDNREKFDAIIVDFSKSFDLVPHGRLLN